jgi:hypothetical protein
MMEVQTHHDSEAIPLVHATMAMDQTFDAEQYYVASVIPSALQPLPPPLPPGYYEPPPETQTRSHYSQDPAGQAACRRGAGVAAGVVGFVLGGSVVAILLGFGAAYATNTDGATGDVARALGEVALVAKKKAREVEEKHNLVDKTKVAAIECLERIKDANRKHHFVKKIKTMVVWTFKSTITFAQGRQLSERGSLAVGNHQRVAPVSSRGVQNQIDEQ